MAPKKSKAPAAFDAADHVDTEGQGLGDFALPKSTVTRIAKSAVPDSAKFEGSVSGALVGGSTVFINYLTALAHDIAQEKGQKTITATHVLEAVKQLGWEDEKEVVKALKGELKAYRKIVEDKKNGTGPPPKPRAPGARPFGRPPKASTSAAISATATTTTSTSPSTDATTEKDVPEASETAPERQADAEEDSAMTVLKDDTLDAREDDGEGARAGGEEEEDDEEAYGTNEEDEAEEEGVDEEVEEEEDRVGDGLEEDQVVQGEGDD